MQEPNMSVERMNKTLMNLITPGQNVAELLARCPQVIPVFMAHRMSCVGCSMSRFENITDITAIYGLNLETFLTEINQSLQEGS